MRIGILGAGGMADALGAQWARAGHEVLVGARAPEKAAALAERIGARAGTLGEAAADRDAVLLAVRYEGVDDVLHEAGAALRGRTLIDCVNGITHPGITLATGGGPSVAEMIAGATGAHVVKAFNLCHESIWRMTPPVFGGRPLAVPLCGDDPAALATARSLVEDLGCAALDGGGLARAGLLEATAAFVIGLLFGGDDPRGMLPPVEYAAGG